MRVRSGYRTVLAVLGAAGLLCMQSVHAQQVSAPANEQVEQMASKEAQDATLQIADGSTITVKTGMFLPLLTAPSFCILSDCNKPNTEIVVEYADSPELSKAFKTALQDKYFYYKGDTESPDVTRKHILTIKTMYLGSTEGYKELLAKNNLEEAERTAKNNSSAIIDLVSLIVTRGNVRTNSGYSNVHSISDKQVADLPAGPKKILVTQITFSFNMGGPRTVAVGSHEALSAAYEDMDDAQLRRVNLEAGLKGITRLSDASGKVIQ